MTDMSEATISDVIHFFFLLDNSGSMSGRAIQTLNAAMSDALSAVTEAAVSIEVTPIMHIVSFNSSINWLLGTQPTSGIAAENLQWHDINAGGGTDTAGAIRSLINSKALSRSHLGHRAYRPIIILITDGCSNNTEETKKAIQELIARQKSLRIAVGVQGYNPTELDAFASEVNLEYEDSLGNTTAPKRQKLIFTVDENINFAELVKNLTVSSLISSKLVGMEDVPGGSTTVAPDPETETVETFVLPGEDDEVWKD